MGYLLLAVLIGVLLGAYPSMPERFYKLGQGILTAGLFILLFFMGVRLGSYPDIMGQLGVIGLKSALFAVVTLAGSVAVVWLIESFIVKGRRRGE